MTSETDCTSWYELQVDTDSDDGRESVSLLHTASLHQTAPISHTSYKHQPLEKSKLESLKPSSDISCFRQTGRGCFIQQLLNEMNDANEKINQYSDAGKSSEGMSLEEFPIDSASHTPKEEDESGCGEVVSSAIAEVSKDFITGNMSTGPLISDKSDDSYMSSDNDFRHRRGASYARYPETAAGLSDNDWNPYVTESDTNISPRVPGNLRPSVAASTADSKLSSLVSSFNPPFCSSRTGSASRVSKMSLHLTDSRPAPENSLPLSYIKEHSEMSKRNISSPKLDASVGSPQLTSSKLSEYSILKHRNETQTPAKSNRSDQEEDAARRQTSRLLVHDTAIGLSSNSQNAKVGERRALDRHVGFDYVSMEESFKKLGSFGDGMTKGLPGQEYFSDAVQSILSGSDGPPNGNHLDPLRDLSGSDGPASGKPTYSAERSTTLDPLRGRTAASCLVGKTDSLTASASKGLWVPKVSAGQAKVSSDLVTRTSIATPRSEVILSAATGDGKESSAASHDSLSKQVDKLLQETAYLTSNAKKKDIEMQKKPGSAISLDYDRLHRDLQEIQDSLQTMGQPHLTSIPPLTSIPSVIDNDDADIIPSTTTTPEKGRQLMWDYAADLGYGPGDLNGLEGMMSDVTTVSSVLDANNLHFTSDGEEARASSTEHWEGEEEEHREDNNLTLTNRLGSAVTAAGIGLDLEELISTFRSEARSMESRYQAVRTQGMADRVADILNSANPDEQAQSILSQISAEERELHHQMSHQASHSGSSKDTTTGDGRKNDDSVRKCLNMSGLSDSASSTLLLNSFLDYQPHMEVAFSATSTAQSLIAAQMKQMADRTFNHSMELSRPAAQEVQCYPVYSSQRDQPQHQQLQQQLQQQLEEQHQRRQERFHAGRREAWPADKKSADSEKSPVSGETTGEKPEYPKDEKLSGVEVEESAGIALSPAESDNSSEINRGRYRPYRPAGIADVYYTESDTASIAESVTTVESTHTGSDDAVGPHFSGNVLGSRHDVPGAHWGIYTKHGRATIPGGSSTDVLLPTIEERITPDPRSHQNSDDTSRACSAQADEKSGNILPKSVEPRGMQRNPGQAEASSDAVVSSILARQQVRVLDILRKKDLSRKVPKLSTSLQKVHEELLAKTREGEIQQSDRLQVGDIRRVRSSGHEPTSTQALSRPSSFHCSMPESQTFCHRALPRTDFRSYNRGNQLSHADKSVRPSAGSSESIPDVPVLDSGEPHCPQIPKTQPEPKMAEKQVTTAFLDQSGDAAHIYQQQADGEADNRRLPDLPAQHVETAPNRNEEKDRADLSGEESDLIRESEHDRIWSRPGTSRQQRELWSETDRALAFQQLDELDKQLEMEDEGRGEDENQCRLETHQSAVPSWEELEDDQITRPEQPGRSHQRSERDVGEGQGNLSDKDDKDEMTAIKCRVGAEHSKGSAVYDGTKSQAIKCRVGAEHAVYEGTKSLTREVCVGAGPVSMAGDSRKVFLEQEEEHRESLGKKPDVKVLRDTNQQRELRNEVQSGQTDRNGQTELDKRKEAELRREAVREREAELRREADRTREAELRREADRTREAELRREADRTREAELRREADRTREAELRREADRTREAELRREADIMREEELRREADRTREAELRREADRKREVELRREAEQRREAERQKQEAELEKKETLKREVELAKRLARRHEHSWETEQREVEEAIQRAGGGEMRLNSQERLDSDREAIVEKQVGGYQQVQQPETEDSIDRQPLSHQAQLLREALEKETADQGGPDLQILWERFIAGSNSGTEADSSLNSEKVHMLADLMRDPSQHLVHRYLMQRQSQQQQDQQKAAVHQRQKDEPSRTEEQATQEREIQHQHARWQQQRISSEEESNGSYGEILLQRERDWQRRREIRNQRKKVGKSPSPTKLNQNTSSSGSAHIGYAFHHGDTADTLYSIAEDAASHDGSPHKSRSPHRSHLNQNRQSTMIDPHLDKLRQHITVQREKIGQGQFKDLRRQQKLDKLKALHDAKNSGLLDDRAFAVHLATISSTSSDESRDLNQVTSSEFSENATTPKDSSSEMRQVRFACNPTTSSWTNERPSMSDTDLLLDTEKYRQLLEDSSSLTESDPVGRHEPYIRESLSRPGQHYSVVSQSPKRNGKSVKFRQTYSPYKRQEVLQHSSSSRTARNVQSSSTKAARPVHSSSTGSIRNHYSSSTKAARPVHSSSTGSTRNDYSSSTKAARPVHSSSTSSTRNASSSSTRSTRSIDSSSVMATRNANSSSTRISASRNQNASTMYPTPKEGSFDHQIRYGGRQVSQGVQTSFDVCYDQHIYRAFSPTYSEQPALPVPLMSSVQRKQTQSKYTEAKKPSLSNKVPRPSRSISPTFDSSQVAACLSPDRERPRSASPDRLRKGNLSPSRARSPPGVELRAKVWTERKLNSALREIRLNYLTPHRDWQDEMSPRRWVKDFDIENQPPVRRHLRNKPKGGRNVSWFIPFQDNRPWRKPFREQQPFASSQQNIGLSPRQWLDLARREMEERKEGLHDGLNGDMARFYLHKATREAERELEEEYDMFDDKPLYRMSLQEALVKRRPDFISALRQRQKRLQLAREHRLLQALVRAEQKKLFTDHRRIIPNPEAHPYSENLHQPKRRIISKQEMREITEKKYKSLPEVKLKEIRNRRNEEYRLNRLRATVFNRKVQRKVLEKAAAKVCFIHRVL